MKLLKSSAKLLVLLTGTFIALTVVAGTHKSFSIEPFDTAHFYMKHSYDVLKYKLDLDIYHCYQTPPSKEFTAKEVITFKVDSALNSIGLNAVNFSLAVDSVGMAAVSFSHLSDTLKIQLTRTFQPGEIVEIEIYFKHKNVTDNAFYAAGGFVFTDTPPEGSRKWFPCWDRPSDKALLDLTAKVPATVKLGSNGKLADSLLIADTLWYHWTSRDPVSTYLITISSKINFLLDIVYWHLPDNPNDSIPARFYYKYPEIPTPMELLIIPMTSFFSEKFGVYPFEKIGFATLNSYFPWGGMENQTLINLRSNGWQEGLISHEFSHQWFGDLITCGTWADVWLNESFATYCESVWIEHTNGYSAYKSHLEGQANYYLGANPGLPIYNPAYAMQTPDPNTLYNTAIVYDKGACVLHQLRYVLGDSLFFQTMRAYSTDSNLKYHSATIQDFNNTVNQVAGGDYNWFFDEWIFQPNHPVYQNTYNFEALGNNQWKVNFFMKQIQTNAPFFKMPADVRIRFTDNTDTTFRIMNDVNSQQFTWILDKQPNLLKFDPDRQIVLKGGGTIVGLDETLNNDQEIGLIQISPNPANTSATLRYEINRPLPVRVEITSMLGVVILNPVNSRQSEGAHELTIDCSTLKPGNYLCKLSAGNAVQFKKLIIIK